MRDAEVRIVAGSAPTDIDDQTALPHRAGRNAARTSPPTLSHELRTPLTRSWVGRDALDGMLDEAARRRAVEVIESSARSQAQLIADLLDVSRISAGRLRSKRGPWSCAPSSRPRSTWCARGRARSIKLSAIRAQAVTVSGDPDRLQQINLEFALDPVSSPRGGRVEVRITSADGHVEITVTDTAPAFTRTSAYVFDRFRQASTT